MGSRELQPESMSPNESIEGNEGVNPALHFRCERCLKTKEKKKKFGIMHH